MDASASSSRPRFGRLLPVVVALGGMLIGAASPVRSTPAAGEGPPRALSETVVVVVSRKSPVTEMSRLQLVDLYLGRTRLLPNGAPAEPIDQEPGSPAREVFYEIYLDRSPAEIKAHWSRIIFTGRGRPPRDVSGGEQMKELVAENPRAIGYMERRFVDESLRVVRVSG